MKEYNFIKERREELGITQRELANKVGISQSCYCRYENNDFKEARICDLEAIIRVLYEEEKYFTLDDVDIDVLYVMGNHITERVKFNISVNQEKDNTNYEEINKELRVENDCLYKTIKTLEDKNEYLVKVIKNMCYVIN